MVREQVKTFFRFVFFTSWYSLDVGDKSVSLEPNNPDSTTYLLTVSLQQVT